VLYTAMRFRKMLMLNVCVVRLHDFIIMITIMNIPPLHVTHVPTDFYNAPAAILCSGRTRNIFYDDMIYIYDDDSAGSPHPTGLRFIIAAVMTIGL